MLKKALFSFGQWLGVTLWPHRCILCHDDVQDVSSLCPPCWAQLDFLTEPQCTLCGVPFDFEVLPHTRCLQCLQEPPRYHQARAAAIYQGPMKELILRFKHADETYMAPVFARWMLRSCPELIYSSDGLIPVPLHWRRLMRRRYNQAALLSKQLSHLTEIPFYTNYLKRHRATPFQGIKNREERRLNVRTAFSLSPQGKKAIQGKTWCIVDDVLTSGATASACAKVLMENGAYRVHIVTIARTPLHDNGL